MVSGGGVLYWLTRDDLESLNLNRKQGEKYLAQAEDRLFWGPSGGTLTELRVVESKYRIVHDPSYDWLIINHRYHVFKPRSLAPGTYVWRWEARSPDDPEGLAVTGSVTVTDR